MKSTLNIWLAGAMWALLLSFLSMACGDMAGDTPGSLTSDLEGVAGGSAEFQARNQVADGVLVADSADDIGEVWHRIEVRLAVRAVGDRLALDVDYYNPADCDWVGHLFVEHELPILSDTAAVPPVVRTLARFYRVRIPSGARITGTIEIRRPAMPGPHRFLARAYYPDGGDREPFYNALVEEAPSIEPPDGTVAESNAEDAELSLADEVLSSTFDVEEPNGIDEVVCQDRRERIRADLRLRVTPRRIVAYTSWQNVTNLFWRGDLYVDVIKPNGRVRLLRRDLGTYIAPGVGFSTIDRMRRPHAPGLYVFHARALHRDGSAVLRWVDPGTTEITGVCNGLYCELIRPEQQRARITLHGPSSIHVESAFFSEFTTVTMAYGGFTFDITDLCRIEQDWGGPGLNYVGVYFDTRELPIGLDTMARYTISLHPMPVVPPGAKLEDSLWIRTNGPECGDDSTALSADCS